MHRDMRTGRVFAVVGIVAWSTGCGGDSTTRSSEPAVGVTLTHNGDSGTLLARGSDAGTFFDDGRDEEGFRATCRELVNLARQEQANASAAADRSCQTSDDCVAVMNWRSSCVPSCGYDLFSAAGAAGLQGDSSYCAQYATMHCPLQAALPCADSPTQPACIDGLCSQVELTTTSSGDDAGAGAAITHPGDAGALLDATSKDAALAASSSCSWPAQLNDGGPGACHVARASLSCVNSAGDGCGCLSDDPTRCDSCEGTGWTCHDQCAANEYAAWCGGPPRHNGSSYDDPPPACRGVSGLPSGTGIYCCPCE